jgi:hypothetical protein
MRNLESLQKKTLGKSKKLHLVPSSKVEPEVTTPGKTTIKNDSISESELFVNTDLGIEKRAMKVPMSWKMPEMCPEFGL